MKATGIVRRIDDLGRIVIPREIRKTCRIKEGDPLEIFVNNQGDVILKRYMPFIEPWELLREIADEVGEDEDLNLKEFQDELLALAGKMKNTFFLKQVLGNAEANHHPL